MGHRRVAAPAALAVPPPPSMPAPPPNTPTGTAQAPSLPVPPARRQPVLLKRTPQSRGARCAEVAGGTAADCAAVCCCCPCGIVNLVVLAVVKVPAGLCRRAFLKKKNKKKRLTSARKWKSDGVGSPAESIGTTRRGLLGPRVVDVDDDEDDDEFVIFTVGGGPVVLGPEVKGLLVGTAVGWPEERSPSVEVSEMDKQMWAHFHGAGFWRSPSQKDV